MKLRNPKSVNDLSIKKGYRVLDIGSGHNPHPKADVIVDKFAGSNYHRSGDIKALSHQKFIEADGQSLPFEDQSFDYTICSHVLEHVNDPVKFLSEQYRVASKGYVETPSILGEYIIPKQSHRWVIQEIDEKIVMYEKEKIQFHAWQDFGYVFQEMLPKSSIGFKVMQRTHPTLTTVNYEWQKDIEVVINPDGSYYRRFFTEPWDESVCTALYGKRTLAKEARASFVAYLDVLRSVFKSKVLASK